MKIKSIFIYGTILLFCFVSCVSRTTIYSTTPGAEVYIGGKYKGTTPYTYSDFLPTGFGRKIEIKKEGYKTIEGKIRKLGRINALALWGSMVAGLPILWVGGYPRFYEYELIPETGTAPIKSDFLTFGKYFPAPRRDFPVYVGSDKGLHYTYTPGFLHVLDHDLTLIESIELAKKTHGVPIDGYLVGDKKRIVEFFPYENSLKIYTLSSDNKLSEFEVENVSYIDEIFAEDYRYGYRRSATTNNFICYSDKALTYFDAALNKVDSYKSEKTILESCLLSDNRILSLELAMNNLFLCLRENGEETYYEINIDNSISNKFFRLNVNEETGKCYISSLTGATKGKDDFLPTGAQIWTYELAGITLTDNKNILFDDKVSNKQNKYLINKGVVSDAENVFMHFEEQWVSTTTSTSGSSSTSYITAALVIINAGKENTPQKKIAKYCASSVHQDKLSYQVQLKNNQLYFVFNIALAGKPILNQVVIDENLETISWNVHDTYKEEKTVFHGLKSYEMEDGRRFYFHQYKSKLGAAISEF